VSAFHPKLPPELAVVSSPADEKHCSRHQCENAKSHYGASVAGRAEKMPTIKPRQPRAKRIAGPVFTLLL